MSPTSCYYLGLYFLVISVRFFKIFKVYSKEKQVEGAVFKWMPVFFVSLEIVYTSAGFIILLLEHSKEWIPVIVILYILLLYFSANFDSLDEKFTEKTKFVFHIIIIVLIVGFTTYSFNSFLSSKNNNDFSHLNSDSTFVFKVAIPYLDNTLIQHLGYKKFKNRKLQVTYTIDAKNSFMALDKAKSKFWEDSTIFPFYLDIVQDKSSAFIIDESSIVVQLIK